MLVKKEIKLLKFVFWVWDILFFAKIGGLEIRIKNPSFFGIIMNLIISRNEAIIQHARD